MPLDQAQMKELKEAITLARKRELNFGLCLGKKPDSTIFMTHKTKSPTVLGKAAKADGETKQVSFGALSANGKELTLVCEGKIHPGMGRKIRELLKAAGISMKIIVTDPEGNSEVGEDEDGEGQTEDAAAEAGEDTAAGGGAGSAPSDDAPENTGDEAADAPASPVIGSTPTKQDLAAEFAVIRQGLMRAMGQMEKPAQAAVQEQFRQFGDMMKAQDFKAAQDLMDDMSAVQGIVTDPQRIRARQDVAQIESYVGDIEAELDALEAAISEQEAAA